MAGVVLVGSDDQVRHSHGGELAETDWAGCLLCVVVLEERFQLME